MSQSIFTCERKNASHETMQATNILTQTAASISGHRRNKYSPRRKRRAAGMCLWGTKRVALLHRSNERVPMLLCRLVYSHGDVVGRGHPYHPAEVGPIRRLYGRGINYLRLEVSTTSTDNALLYNLGHISRCGVVVNRETRRSMHDRLMHDDDRRRCRRPIRHISRTAGSVVRPAAFGSKSSCLRVQLFRAFQPRHRTPDRYELRR